MNDTPSVRNYFRRSPFRSLGFDVATTVLVLFIFSTLRTMRVQSPTLKASAAVFGLVLLPVAVWIVSLLLHWEIRSIVDQANEVPTYPQIARLHYSRLARLHWSLPLGVTIIAWGITQALVTTIH